MNAIHYARAHVSSVAEALGMSEETRQELPQQVLHFVSLDGESFLPVSRRPTLHDYDELRSLFQSTESGISPMRWGRPIVEGTAGSIEVIGE